MVILKAKFSSHTFKSYNGCDIQSYIYAELFVVKVFI